MAGSAQDEPASDNPDAKPESLVVVDPKSTVPVAAQANTDGRQVGSAKSRYEEVYRKQQRAEGWYIFALLLGSTGLIGLTPLGFIEGLCSLVQTTPSITPNLRGCFLLAVSGLLGGTVYGAKWLYHAVAWGVWNEDRKLWRYLSPWISLGVAVGVGALIHSGFLRGTAAVDVPSTSGASLVGTGFLIGYFSDKALAKMRDVTEVIFGETRPAGTRPRTRDVNETDEAREQ